MKRILCIDAQDSEQRHVQAAAELAGYEVLATADADQALQWLASEKVDGVLLDCCLPGVDTASLERALLHIDPSVPLLLFSGINAGTDIGLRCMDAYLQSPAPPDSVLARAARSARTNS